MWPRCSEVEIDEGQIFYKLAREKKYDLVAAYGEQPHLQFVNCKSDGDFKKFLLRYGPIQLNALGRKIGWELVPLRNYEAARRFLRAVVRIMDACKKAEGQRAALTEFFSAAINNLSPGLLREEFKCDFASYVARQIGDSPIEDPIKWSENTTEERVRKALALAVEDWFRTPRAWGFRVQPHGKAFRIQPSFELHDLWDALRWMFFFDEWNHRPPILCRECPTIFHASTAHARKFCSPECAHRAANRVWRQKDLRKQKVKTKRSRESDGTHKTR